MTITSEEAHASFKDFMKNEEMEINAGKSAVIAESFGIEVDNFRFEVISRITPAQIRLIANVDENSSYNELIHYYAKFMAEVSVHPDMKSVKFWEDFDYETGYLPDVVGFIINNTERVGPVIKKFR